MLERVMEKIGLRPSWEKWMDFKSSYYREVLGESADVVMHAIIPFSVGGSLDWYFYPNHLPDATVMATMELSDQYNRGARNRIYRNYEIIMAVKLPLEAFTGTERSPEVKHLYTTMNQFAFYSQQATLNPGETIEFPADFEVESLQGACFVIDSYPAGDGKRKFGLMLLMQIHRSEMEHAMKNGAGELMRRLREAGYYPYTGTDRPAVL